MFTKEILKKYKNSDKVALKYQDVEITYRELYKKCFLASAQITQLKGKCILLYMQNSIEYIISFLAITLSGKSVFPIHYGEVVNHVLEIACSIGETEILVEQEKKIIFEENNNNKNIKILTFDELFEHNLEGGLEEKNENEKFLLLNTSGTSNSPKIVVHSSKSIYSNMRACVEAAKIGEKDIGLIIMPMTSAYTITEQILAYLSKRMTIIIVPMYAHPRNIYELIEREKVSRFECVPSTLGLLVQYKHWNKYNLSSLEHLGVGGSSISRAIVEQAYKIFGNAKIIQSYGLTEAGPLVTIMNEEKCRENLTSVGKVVTDTMIKIQKEDYAKMIGEVLVKGPGIMEGYYNELEETKKVLKDGWLHTGDLGMIDENGFLYILGRKKNVIKQNGYRICPEEVESVISSYPGIKDVKVVGRYEREKEILVAQIEYIDEEIDFNNIKTYCKHFLPGYKIPKVFEKKEIQRTNNGKIRRTD